MKTSTLIAVSAIVWVIGTLAYGKETLAAIAVGTHVIVWCLHRVEVKLNKLLDASGVFVSEPEMSE